MDFFFRMVEYRFKKLTYKYNGNYYWSYVGTTGEFKYCISDNPLGPFEYKGAILPKMNSGTNHHSIAEYYGRWFIFYHNADLYYQNHPEAERKFVWGHQKDLTPFRRSICVDRFITIMMGQSVRRFRR